MAQNGPKWLKMAQNDHNWLKLIRIDNNWQSDLKFAGCLSVPSAAKSSACSRPVIASSSTPVNTRPACRWSARFAISAKHGCVTVKNVFQLTPAVARCKTQFASSASAEFGSTVVEFFRVRFVAIFYAKTINLNIKPLVKLSKPKVWNVKVVTSTANFHVYDVKHVIVMTMYDEKVSNMKKINRFRVQSADTKRRRRRASRCRREITNLGGSNPGAAMGMMIQPVITLGKVNACYKR